MPEPTPPPLPLTISPIATLTPASASRAWQTIPHPSLPIAASCSSDKTVRIYSLTSFHTLSTITGGHKRSIRAVAWKPNTKGESVLATGSFDASAGIWRRWEIEGEGIKAREGERAGEEKEKEGEVEVEVEEMDFTRHGEDEDDEWRFSVILEGHESEIKSLAFSSGGQYLATCSRDKSVWIWEELADDEFETIAVLQEHSGDVKCVAWHPSEDLLASGSYDDTVRLYREDLDDWGCVAVLRGHASTVWWVGWEPLSNVERLGKGYGLSEKQQLWMETKKKSGPRLISASDDQTIRLWRRSPKDGADYSKPIGQSFPSILRTGSIEEDWSEEARLPQRHERAIYSVDWSKESGRIVSTGSDGKVIVYEERWKDSMDTEPEQDSSNLSQTEWIVVAELEGAHDVFEVNHVCWAKRSDKGRRSDNEEMIMSTGDDGEVKLWRLDSS